MKSGCIFTQKSTAIFNCSCDNKKKSDSRQLCPFDYFTQMWKVIKSEFFNRQCQNKSGKKLLVEQIKRSIIPPNGSVVECFSRDRGAAGSSLTSVTTLCP